MKKIKTIGTIFLCGVTLFGLAVFSWIKAPTAYSVSERRALAQLPAPTSRSLLSGTFMSSFDEYSMDQFPMRDGFRTFKAVMAKTLLGQKDSHGLYSIDGNLSKLEYPINQQKVNTAIRKINEIQKLYLEDTDCRTFLALIPDKNAFLAPLGNYPIMDYDALTRLIREGVDCQEYIDITDLLSLEDYYRTDQHWRQEQITDIADRIGSAMQPKDYQSAEYEEKLLDYPFYGAYVGQAALPFAADTIHYLTNQELEHCRVVSYNSGTEQEAAMYDMGKAYGRDPYEMFLSGSDALLRIDNPDAKSDRELIVFRDSFGSSLVPLLVHNYRSIWVADLRYIRSSLLGNYLSFEGQDVLFLYSTLLPL